VAVGSEGDDTGQRKQGLRMMNAKSMCRGISCDVAKGREGGYKGSRGVKYGPDSLQLQADETRGEAAADMS